MKLLENILLPTDLSASSEKAVEASIQLAKAFKSRITLLHVYSEENFPEETEKFLEIVIKENLEKIKTKIIEADIEVADVIMERGVAFEKIIQIAQDRDVNVIMVGSGSKKENDNFKLGTTVEKLMRKNQIPLWVVKNEAVKPIQRILCPVDFSNSSIRAFQNAVTLAERFKAELNLIHVVEPVKNTSARLSVNVKEENQRRRDLKKKELNNFLSNYQLHHMKLTKELLMGEPFLEILRYAKRNKSDLLIMGTTGKTGLSKLLMGSVTEKVTRELPASFVTTKAKDITDNYLESNLKGIESILNPAKSLLKKGKYEPAIEKFLIGIKQYPDNIPMLKGIIKAYEAAGNEKKANYYKDYMKEVVERIWGDEYINMINLDE